MPALTSIIGPAVAVAPASDAAAAPESRETPRDNQFSTLLASQRANARAAELPPEPRATANAASGNSLPPADAAGNLFPPPNAPTPDAPASSTASTPTDASAPKSETDEDAAATTLPTSAAIPALLPIPVVVETPAATLTPSTDTTAEVADALSLSTAGEPKLEPRAPRSLRFSESGFPASIATSLDETASDIFKTPDSEFDSVLRPDTNVDTSPLTETIDRNLLRLLTGNERPAIIADSAHPPLIASALSVTTTPISTTALPVTAAHLPAVSINQPGWEQAMEQRVGWMIDQATQSAQINVNPPDLGPIEVRIDVQHDQTSVTFASTHAPVRDSIEAALPRLRDMLAQNGLNLANVDVSARTFARGQQDRAPIPRLAGMSGEPIHADTIKAPMTRVGLIDLYA